MKMLAHRDEQIEDDLYDLELKIAKINARRNAQINLLQKSIAEKSLKNNIYFKPDILKNCYYDPVFYHSPITYPSPSYHMLKNRFSTNKHSEPRKSKNVPVIKLLPPENRDYKRTTEYSRNVNVLAKLKDFITQQESELADAFAKKTVNSRTRNNYLSTSNVDVSEPLTRRPPPKSESMFLKPINKKDKFYKRYNTFMRKVLEPFQDRNQSPAANDTSFTTNEYGGAYRARPIEHDDTSSLTKTNGSKLVPRPWWYPYSSSTAYLRNKYYQLNMDSVIRDLEPEYLKPTYPSSYKPAYKYDPFAADSYIKSSLPNWKQYYYTHKLRSQPSNKRVLDYDSYYDFFPDRASPKSDHLLTPISNDYSDDSVVNPEQEGDVQIIEQYRDLIFEDIIKCLRNRQKRTKNSSLKKNIDPDLNVYHASILSDRNEKSDAGRSTFTDYDARKNRSKSDVPNYRNKNDSNDSVYDRIDTENFRVIEHDPGNNSLLKNYSQVEKYCDREAENPFYRPKETPKNTSTSDDVGPATENPINRNSLFPDRLRYLRPSENISTDDTIGNNVDPASTDRRIYRKYSSFESDPPNSRSRNPATCDRSHYARESPTHKITSDDVIPIRDERPASFRMRSNGEDDRNPKTDLVPENSVYRNSIPPDRFRNIGNVLIDETASNDVNPISEERQICRKYSSIESNPNSNYSSYDRAYRNPVTRGQLHYVEESPTDKFTTDDAIPIYEINPSLRKYSSAKEGRSPKIDRIIENSVYQNSVPADQLRYTETASITDVRKYSNIENYLDPKDDDQTYRNRVTRDRSHYVEESPKDKITRNDIQIREKVPSYRRPKPDQITENSVYRNSILPADQLHYTRKLSKNETAGNAVNPVHEDKHTYRKYSNNGNDPDSRNDGRAYQNPPPKDDDQTYQNRATRDRSHYVEESSKDKCTNNDDFIPIHEKKQSSRKFSNVVESGRRSSPKIDHIVENVVRQNSVPRPDRTRYAVKPSSTNEPFGNDGNPIPEHGQTYRKYSRIENDFNSARHDRTYRGDPLHPARESPPPSPPTDKITRTYINSDDEKIRTFREHSNGVGKVVDSSSTDLAPENPPNDPEIRDQFYFEPGPADQIINTDREQKATLRKYSRIENGNERLSVSGCKPTTDEHSGGDLPTRDEFYRAEDIAKGYDYDSTYEKRQKHAENENIRDPNTDDRITENPPDCTSVTTQNTAAVVPATMHNREEQPSDECGLTNEYEKQNYTYQPSTEVSNSFEYSTNETNDDCYRKNSRTIRNEERDNYANRYEPLPEPDNVYDNSYHRENEQQYANHYDGGNAAGDRNYYEYPTRYAENPDHYDDSNAVYDNMRGIVGPHSAAENYNRYDNSGNYYAVDPNHQIDATYSDTNYTNNYDPPGYNGNNAYETNEYAGTPSSDYTGKRNSRGNYGPSGNSNYGTEKRPEYDEYDTVPRYENVASRQTCGSNSADVYESDAGKKIADDQNERKNSDARYEQNPYCEQSREIRNEYDENTEAVRSSVQQRAEKVSMVEGNIGVSESSFDTGESAAAAAPEQDNNVTELVPKEEPKRKSSKVTIDERRKKIQSRSIEKSKSTEKPIQQTDRAKTKTNESKLKKMPSGKMKTTPKKN